MTSSSYMLLCRMQVLHKFYQVERADNIFDILSMPLFVSVLEANSDNRTVAELQEYRTKVAARVNALGDQHAKKVHVTLPAQPQLSSVTCCLAHV